MLSAESETVMEATLASPKIVPTIGAPTPLTDAEKLVNFAVKVELYCASVRASVAAVPVSVIAVIFVAAKSAAR